MKKPFEKKGKQEFQGVSIVVTTEPLFVEAKAAPDATAVDILNAYGTTTELVKALLMKVGIAEDVVHSSMNYAHNQALSKADNTMVDTAKTILQ